MNLGDVLTQYYVSSSAPAVLGATTTDGGVTTTSVQKRLPADASVTIIKGLRYSEGSAVVIKKTVKKGETSDEVKKLQLVLIAKGYLNADPSGKYGAATIAAVKKFQAEKGIKGDGTLVGPATRAAIAADVAAATPDVKQ